MARDPVQEMDAAPSRFVVGVDLGTTNSAVCYVDSEEQNWRVQTFATPQLIDAGQIEERETLPSFHYQPAAGEFAQDALRLPWSSSTRSKGKRTSPYMVGVFAREHGSKTPGRQISSAKSWLSHTGVDRTAELLPWHGADDVDRLSPIEVSARILDHIRQAWNHRHTDHPLEDQDLILTLPASFDEVARELTVEAAARAGLNRVVLIEEPQAAFYAWLNAHDDTWESLVEPGQKILVCDIGGGTSDFTLIRVRRSDHGQVQFHRVAVGEHLILGGDNLDLALARHLEQQLGVVAGGPRGQADQLDPHQWDVLLRACRNVKESLLGDHPPETMTVNLPGRGSKLIGGGMNLKVSKDEVQAVLLDGFFPLTSLDQRPNTVQSGFQEFGLPYAPDPAVTKYLAQFLTNHRHTGDDPDQAATSHNSARPDIVLFNGGLFLSTVIQQRIITVLKNWFGDAGPHGWSPTLLRNVRLDLAVAQGAAYYGMVRRGKGVRIAAGLARSYYIGVEGDPPAAVCLVPGNAEPGDDIELGGRTFQLRISQPVEFPLLVSSTRLADSPGEVVAIDREQMKPLPPIRTVLKTRRRQDQGEIEVQLHARLSEIGTLDLWCSQANGDRRWNLQFDVRSATQTDIEAEETTGEHAGVIDEATWQKCETAIRDTMQEGAIHRPDKLIGHMTEALELPREDWPPTLLRRIWGALMDHEQGRRLSAKHEARWINLLGYALRPGYGLPVDDWRVAQTWRLLQGRLLHESPACRHQSWILWRRIAGGLSSGQQRAVAEPLLSPIRALYRRMVSGKTRGEAAIAPQDSHEAWRLLGSLELLSAHSKTELGDWIVQLLGKRKLESVRPAMVWTLGRLGQRDPVYGPLNTVVPAKKAVVWLRGVMEIGGDSEQQLAVMQLARRTNDRHRDVPQVVQKEVIDWLEKCGAPGRFVRLICEKVALDDEEQNKVFGEALPIGLRLN